MYSERRPLPCAGLLLIVLAFGCTTPSIVATKSIREGDALHNQHRYSEAIVRYEKYLEVSPQLGLYRNPTMEAEVCRKLGQAYATQGNYSKGTSFVQRALREDSLQSNSLAVIEDHRQLGTLYAYAGDFRQALRHLNYSLASADKMENSVKTAKRSSLAFTHLHLAQVHLTLGNFRDTEDHAQKALNLFLAVDETRGTIEAKLVLAMVARDAGRLEVALKEINDSNALAEKSGLNTSAQNQIMGDIYLIEGNPEQGIRHKLMAIDEAERSKIRPLIIQSYSKMGDAYRRIGDNANADRFYEKAVKLQNQLDVETSTDPRKLNMNDPKEQYEYFVSAGSSIGAGLASLKLGEMKLTQGKRDSARLMLSNARTLFERSNNVEGISKADLMLGKVSLADDRREEAFTYFEHAATINPQPDIVWQSWFGKGLTLEASGKPDEARGAYRKAIGVIDALRASLSIEEFKTLFAHDKVAVFDHLIMLLMKEGIATSNNSIIEEAFDYNEQSRSRTFLDMLGNRKIDARQTADSTLLNDEQLLRMKVNQLSRQLTNAGDKSRVTQQQLSDELDRAQVEYVQVLNRIKLENPEYASMINVLPPTLRQMQVAIAPGTAVLEYWVSEQGAVAVWIVDRNNVFARVIDIDPRDLARQIRGCRSALAIRNQELATQSLETLARWLVAPDLPRLKKYQQLVIVPHNSLHFIPFQALTVDNCFLVEDFIISMAPSMAVYDYCVAKKDGTGAGLLAMALGNSEIGGYPALPGTTSELRQISRIVKDATVQEDSTFTESVLKEHAGAFEYLHIATHGVFNQHQPLYSYLLMNSTSEDDGRLTTNEVFSLNINSRFVVLSACETGLGTIGNGDELTGLSRAFLYAGASGVVVSLWAVDDATTAWLMTHFYHYIQEGYTPSHSLTLAQRDVLQTKMEPAWASGARPVKWNEELSSSISTRNKQEMRNPYYWAPFILIGDGGAR